MADAAGGSTTTVKGATNMWNDYNLLRLPSAPGECHGGSKREGGGVVGCEGRRGAASTGGFGTCSDGRAWV